MGNFVRGGQLITHSFRMNYQVWKILMRCVLAIMLSGVLYTFYNDIGTYDWKNVPGYIKKEVAFFDEAVVTYYTEYGYKHEQTKKFAKNNPAFKRLEQKVERALYKGLITGGVLSAILLMGTVFYFYRTGKNRTVSMAIRGIFLEQFDVIKKKVEKHNKAFPYIPHTIAEMPYPITGEPRSFTSGEQSHTMIIGSTGSGKTTIIRELLYSIHCRGEKAIIVDVKGDYIEKAYREDMRTDIILNPLDKRSRNWSIFKETTALTGFATIAKALIPVDSKDPTWTEAARAVFTEMANSYAGANLSLAEFTDKILKTDIKVLEAILKKTYAGKIINTEIEKAALSVMMVMSSYLRPLKLYRSNENCFSIRDWILEDTWNKEHRQHGFLFLSSRAEAKRDLNPIITAQVDIAINAMRSMGNSSSRPKIWFILDELGYFDTAIPNLIDGLTTARSYGGCFVLGTQDITTVSKIYSRERAETITNNCRTKIFMNVEGAETARWCSNNSGVGEVEEWSESFSYGAHEMRDGQSATKIKRMKAAVLDGEFQILKTGEGYIKLSGYNPVKFTARKPRLGDIAKPYIENEKLYGLLVEEREEQEKYRIKVEKRFNKGTNILDLVKEGGAITDDQISNNVTIKKPKQGEKTSKKENSAKLVVTNDIGNDW